MNPFQIQVRVYYEDTDLGGVVYYANYLRFFERDAAGRILSERAIAIGEVKSLVKDPKTPVLIAGDKDVKYEAVLQVMDELRAKGVERVGLQVKPRQ